MARCGSLMMRASPKAEYRLALAGGRLSFQGFSHAAELRHHFEQGRSDVRLLRRAGELQAFFGALPIVVGGAERAIDGGIVRHSVLAQMDKGHECGLFPGVIDKWQQTLTRCPAETTTAAPSRNLKPDDPVDAKLAENAP